MFVDRVKIFVKGGDGGRGCVSFRREPYVPRGGPDGGRGGRGGNVLLVAIAHQNTLLPLRFHTEFRADRGSHGGPGNRTGGDGANLMIHVPPGTGAFDLTSGEAMGEVLREGDRLLLARGGRGGRGNRAFLTNQDRAPRRCEEGGLGEERWLQLDLRLIADVGLLGVPNAGKSTLLAGLSAARPKIGDYPFTTLTPVLGVVEVDEESFVAADVPGILEGAHAGVGLGLDFLRHIQRTRVLLHVVDASGRSGRDPEEDLLAVREEARLWDASLLERPQLLAATKRDIVGEGDPLAVLERIGGELGIPVFPVSANTGVGIAALKHSLLQAVREARAPRVENLS